MTFSDFNNKFQLFVSDLNKNMGLVVQANEKPLVQINRDQLLSGNTNEGKPIEPTLRSFMYADEKKKKGGKAPFGIPDMKNTGAFQDAMILETDDRNYYILSTDDKTSDLTKKYKGLFGISPNNQAKAQAVNMVKLAQLLKQATGL